MTDHQLLMHQLNAILRQLTYMTELDITILGKLCPADSAALKDAIAKLQVHTDTLQDAIANAPPG